MQHCSDNKADRNLGAYWERRFCAMAGQQGFLFTPLQIGKKGSAVAYHYNDAGWNQYTLPDVTIWTCPGQHHEIKHKNPTKNGYFGLEAYRYYALLNFAMATRQAVLYTIHNHDLSGGRDATQNDISHWLTIDVKRLQKPAYDRIGPSWIDGKKESSVKVLYWPTSWWIPLKSFWKSLSQE